MNITSTATRFTATWTIDIAVEPGSVPDRPVPYSRNGGAYRPARVTLKFGTQASHDDPAALKLENGSGFLAEARDSIRVDGVHISGARLKKDGQPGQVVVTERFYGQDGQPGWVRELITATREKLA